jgi:RNA polymerase sigma factor (sigma-70 family)
MIAICDTAEPGRLFGGRATNGSREELISMDTIVEQFGPALWRLAGSFEFDTALREDLVQDMLVAIWQALPRLDNPASIKAYVFRIARNRAISHVAREAARPRSDVLKEEHQGDLACPNQQAEINERQRRLLEAVRSLPLNQREAVSLFLEGLSHAEIAEILEISENNAAVRINRARTRLSERLSA